MSASPSSAVRPLLVVVSVACTGGSGRKSDSTAPGTPSGTTDSGTVADTAWDGILASIGTTVVMPRFADTATAAAALSTQAQAFCAAPDAAGLLATQEAWHAVMAPWKQSEVGQFGPVWMEPWRVGPKVDFWPARPDSIEDLLEDDFAVDAESVGNLGTVHRGLPVLDWTLFEPGDDTLAAFTDPTTGARRCDYLMGLTGDTAHQLLLLHDVWSPEGDNWLANYTDPSEATELMSTREAMDEVVNRAIFAVENIRALKLGKPAGQDSGGTPQPDALESPQSGRSLQDALDALQGVNDTLLGDYAGVDGPGLLDAIPDPHMRDQITADYTAAYSAAVSAVQAVPAPLSDTIFADPTVVDLATSAIRDLQVVLQVDLAQALSVTIRFNDTDGD